MTNLQQTEFEMLKEFVRICDELRLKYFLVCGSALGAVKYNGFIPWDDDMDVAMVRRDYEIFCKKAPDMLPDHLFLQNHHTDNQYPHIFSKIRNSNTTYIEKGLADLDIHHGVYIDVFPLDGYPEKTKEANKLEKRKRNFHLAQLSCLKFKASWKVKLLVGVERLLGFHKNPSKLAENIEKHISKYSTHDSFLWCNHGNWQGKLEYAPKEQYGEGVFVDFEGIKVRIPEKYDEYLTQKYGNWRADLPKEEQVGHHYYDVCDLERPYTDYIIKEKSGKIRVVTDPLSR